MSLSKKLSNSRLRAFSVQAKRITISSVLETHPVENLRADEER